MSEGQPAEIGTIETDVPARLDRLPWSRPASRPAPGRHAEGRAKRLRRNQFAPLAGPSERTATQTRG